MPELVRHLHPGPLIATRACPTGLHIFWRPAILFPADPAGQAALRFRLQRSAGLPAVPSIGLQLHTRGTRQQQVRRHSGRCIWRRWTVRRRWAVRRRWTIRQGSLRSRRTRRLRLRLRRRRWFRCRSLRRTGHDLPRQQAVRRRVQRARRWGQERLQQQLPPQRAQGPKRRRPGLQPPQGRVPAGRGLPDPRQAVRRHRRAPPGLAWLRGVVRKVRSARRRSARRPELSRPGRGLRWRVWSPRPFWRPSSAAALRRCRRGETSAGRLQRPRRLRRRRRLRRPWLRRRWLRQVCGRLRRQSGCCVRLLWHAGRQTRVYTVWSVCHCNQVLLGKSGEWGGGEVLHRMVSMSLNHGVTWKLESGEWGGGYIV